MWGDELVGEEPGMGGWGIGADEEDFLDGADGGEEAFETGGCGVLDFEAEGAFAAAGFDDAGDDAGDMGAVMGDEVEDWVEACDAAMLSFDVAELHGVIIGAVWKVGLGFEKGRGGTYDWGNTNRRDRNGGRHIEGWGCGSGI